jgi:arginase family enzyme
VREATAWVRACGADRRVRCFDLMELNPRHDVGGRTARVAAHLFLTFLAGFAQR